MEKIIMGWYCRFCRRSYHYPGLCEDCGEFLKPIVPQFPEVPNGEV